MSKLERAKAFVANNLKRSALIIVPLAAVAIQCQASVTFSMDGGSILASGGGVSTVVNNKLAGVQLLNGVNGISLSGKGTFTASGSGLGNSGSFSCGAMCATFFAFGSVSGSFDSDSLLITYLINLSDNNNIPIDWSLDVVVAGKGTKVTGTTAAGGETLDASFLVTDLSEASLPSGWEATFLADFRNNFNGGDSIVVDVPSGTTVDIGAVSATPEPGTAGLLAIAGAALVGLRKRLLRR
jgi:hypothetical protein